MNSTTGSLKLAISDLPIRSKASEIKKLLSKFRYYGNIKLFEVHPDGKKPSKICQIKAENRNQYAQIMAADLKLHGRHLIKRPYEESPGNEIGFYIHNIEEPGKIFIQGIQASTSDQEVREALELNYGQLLYFYSVRRKNTLKSSYGFARLLNHTLTKNKDFNGLVQLREGITLNVSVFKAQRENVQNTGSVDKTEGPPKQTEEKKCGAKRTTIRSQRTQKLKQSGIKPQIIRLRKKMVLVCEPREPNHSETNLQIRRA